MSRSYWTKARLDKAAVKHAVPRRLSTLNAQAFNDLPATVVRLYDFMANPAKVFERTADGWVWELDNELTRAE